MTGRPIGRKDYGRELKYRAVQMYLDGKKSQSIIAQELGLPNKRRVKIWIKQYREEGEEAFLKLKGRPARSKTRKHILPV